MLSVSQGAECFCFFSLFVYGDAFYLYSDQEFPCSTSPNKPFVLLLLSCSVAELVIIEGRQM